MLTSVKADRYDREYFENVFRTIDFHIPVTETSFGHIYRTAASLADILPADHVVDFGCGSGDMTMYLFWRFGCRVTGIDYSADAIAVAKEHQKLFVTHNQVLEADRLQFLEAKNEALPALTDIQYVFLTDVIEHLYDPEIAVILSSFPRWKGTRPLRLVFHTDNNNFLWFIRPVLDLLSLITGRTTRQIIHERNVWEGERHVNLTTPHELSQIVDRHGYVVEKVMYSPLDLATLRQQLGSLGGIEVVVRVAFFLAKHLTFLRPSFYLVARYEQK